MLIIFYGVMVFFAVILYVTGRSAAKINHHILLNVTLPVGEENNQEVQEIVCRYSRHNSRLFLGAMAAGVPLFLVREYPSFSLLYLYGWIVLLLIGYDQVFKHAYKQLYQLKKERGWLVGKQHMVTVDTEVSRLKRTMPVSRWWFLPPLLFAAIPLGLLLSAVERPQWSELLYAGSSLGMVGILFWIRNGFAGQRAVAYSRDTRINQACCYLFQRGWSVCWTVAAWVESLTLLVPGLSLWQRRSSASEWGILSSLVGILFTVVFIHRTHQSIRTRQNRLLAVEQEAVYIDEDEYWKNGNYENPNDSRVMVEKRVGYGLTCNMATWQGKAVVYGILGLAAVLVLVIFVQMLRMDVSGISLTVENGTATVQAPMYGTSFSMEEVQEVALLEALPNGVRTNGMSTDRYQLGHFRLDGYGDSLVYIIRVEPPYLLIRLPDRIILLNGRDAQETGRYQALLEQNMPK